MHPRHSGSSPTSLHIGFAALPKLPDTGLSRSTEDLLAGTSLPPLPDEITEESEMQLLDDKLRRLQRDAGSIDNASTSPPPDTQSISSNDSSGSRVPSLASSHTGKGEGLAPSPINAGTPTELRRWHANLEARLHPFWSSVLSNRTVRVSLYAADPSIYDTGGRYTDESSSSQGSVAPEKQPILTREVVTAVDGSFQLKLSVPWNDMCLHPGALHIAFGGAELEQEMFVIAKLLAPPSPGPATPAAQYQCQHPQRRLSRSLASPVSPAMAISVPLTYSSVRVISDIDDTVKLSGILTGARAVFRNVFVKDLRDSVIRGMGEWYTGMWKRGVRFHYVVSLLPHPRGISEPKRLFQSNGPFELLPVVNDFLQLSQLPPGSVRLRSYGGRSLFNGLLSAPAMRKRTAVVDVLNHFPDARFFLVGDSGEQDLELYAEIARERPEQILAIFIRDANVRDNDTMRPLDDPTGAEAFRWAMEPGSGATTPVSATNSGFVQPGPRRTNPRQASRSMSEATPGSPPAVPAKATRSFSGLDPGVLSRNPNGSSSSNYFSSTLRSYSPITEEPPKHPVMTADQTSWPPPGFSKPPPGSQAERRESRWSPQTPSSMMSLPDPESERRRYELQTRVWRARLDVDPGIPIRMFREPEECVEVNEILDRLQLRRQ